MIAEYSVVFKTHPAHPNSNCCRQLQSGLQPVVQIPVLKTSAENLKAGAD